jgi:hypothetical protein
VKRKVGQARALPGELDIQHVTGAPVLPPGQHHGRARDSARAPARPALAALAGQSTAAVPVSG